MNGLIPNVKGFTMWPAEPGPAAQIIRTQHDTHEKRDGAKSGGPGDHRAQGLRPRDSESFVASDKSILGASVSPVRWIRI